MLAQKVCGDFGRAFVVNVDPGVELAHGFVVQQVSQRLELRFEVRVRVEVPWSTTTASFSATPRSAPFG